MHYQDKNVARMAELVNTHALLVPPLIYPQHQAKLPDMFQKQFIL